MVTTDYPSEYDAILKTLQLYIDGSKQGKSELMRPAFHSNATFFGYVGTDLAMGTDFLFDWIDKNGPAAGIQPRFVSVDILDSIAVVRLEVAGWSGAMAGDATCSHSCECPKVGGSSKRPSTGTHKPNQIS